MFKVLYRCNRTIERHAEGTVIRERGYDATLKDVLKADMFLLGLPLNDGTTTVVPLGTEGPSFKKFVDRCAADFAKLAPAPPVASPPERRSPPSLFKPGTDPGPWAKAMLNPP